MFKISAASAASCITAQGFVLLPFVAPDIWDVKLFNEEAQASLLISSVVPPRCAGCMNTKWIVEGKRTEKEKVFLLNIITWESFSILMYILLINIGLKLAYMSQVQV